MPGGPIGGWPLPEDPGGGGGPPPGPTGGPVGPPGWVLTAWATCVGSASPQPRLNSWRFEASPASHFIASTARPRVIGPSGPGSNPSRLIVAT